MNRPPTFWEEFTMATVTYGWQFETSFPNWKDEEYMQHADEMREALFCEWLIERGLMPDPTEFVFEPIDDNRMFGWITEDMLREWVCEDKTQ
jgi:hypothetical protein